MNFKDQENSAEETVVTKFDNFWTKLEAIERKLNARLKFKESWIRTGMAKRNNVTKQ